MQGQMKQPFSLLLGRKTFKIWEPYWPVHADQWPGINESTKYVASKTLSSSDWENCVFLNGDLVEEVKKLKKENGPDIQVYGSANLAQTLLKNDLIDEMWLKIFPVLLGKGKKLFDEGTIPAAFKLTDTQISPSGVIFANYKRDGEVKIGSVE